MNLLALLNHTDLFGSLSEAGKRRIAEIGLQKELRKNQTLFCEGERGYGIYLLASGGVRLSKSSIGGEKSVVIKSVKPGEVFAEVVLFEEDRFPVTATAVKNSLVYLFPKKQFLCLLEDAAFRDEFIVMLLRKQRYLTERLRSLVTMDVEDKLFHYLRQHYGEKARIAPGISKKDLAAAIDVAPETLSRALRRLEERGVLAWKGGEIVMAEGFWREYGGAGTVDGLRG